MKLLIPSVILAGGMFLAGLPQVAVSSKTVWTAKADLPVGMAEVGVAELDGKVYVVGGTAQEQNQSPAFASTVTMRYDPARNAWEGRAPLPIASSHAGVAALDGKLYAIGGFGNAVHMEPQATAFVYDPSTDSWSALPNLSTPRGSVTVAAVDGKIHAFGGRESTEIIELPPIPGLPKLFSGYGTVTTHEVYDPATGQWSTAAPVPGPARDHIGVAVLDGKVHLIGGRTADFVDNVDRHDVYDPATDTWSVAAPLPRPRSAGAATVLDGLIVYAGGECNGGDQPGGGVPFGDVDAFDPAGDRWESLTPLPAARHAFGAATVGSTAYFMAGALACGGGASTDTLALDL